VGKNYLLSCGGETEAPGKDQKTRKIVAKKSRNLQKESSKKMHLFGEQTIEYPLS